MQPGAVAELVEHSPQLWEIGSLVPGRTIQGGRMNRVAVSHAGRSGILNPDPAGSNLGRIKPMTLKLILVAS